MELYGRGMYDVAAADTVDCAGDGEEGAVLHAELSDAVFVPTVTVVVSHLLVEVLALRRGKTWWFLCHTSLIRTTSRLHLLLPQPQPQWQLLGPSLRQREAVYIQMAIDAYLVCHLVCYDYGGRRSNQQRFVHVCRQVGYWVTVCRLVVQLAV